MSKSGKVIATTENLLRRKLSEIRDEAMELAAIMEFGYRGDCTETPLWQLAAEIIRKTEEAMQNKIGELDVLR